MTTDTTAPRHELYPSRPHPSRLRAVAEVATTAAWEFSNEVGSSLYEDKSYFDAAYAEHVGRESADFLWRLRLPSSEWMTEDEKEERRRMGAWPGWIEQQDADMRAERARLLAEKLEPEHFGPALLALAEYERVNTEIAGGYHVPVGEVERRLRRAVCELRRVSRRGAEHSERIELRHVATISLPRPRAVCRRVLSRAPRCRARRTRVRRTAAKPASTADPDGPEPPGERAQRRALDRAVLAAAQRLARLHAGGAS